MTRFRLLPLVLLLVVGGCATRKYMMSRPLDNGLKAVYAAPFDKVKRAAYDALAELTYGVKDEKWDERDKECFVINSSQGLGSGTAGRYARVVLQKGEAEQTVYVLVESKAASRDSSTADEDAAKGIQSRIEKRVTNK
jgi:hypothetical protein